MCFVQQIEEKLKIKGFASKSSTGFILTFFPNLVLLVTVSRSGVTQQQESKLAWIAYTASLISSATICVIMLPKEQDKRGCEKLLGQLWHSMVFSICIY